MIRVGVTCTFCGSYSQVYFDEGFPNVFKLAKQWVLDCKSPKCTGSSDYIRAVCAEFSQAEIAASFEKENNKGKAS